MARKRKKLNRRRLRKKAAKYRGVIQLPRLDIDEQTAAEIETIFLVSFAVLFLLSFAGYLGVVGNFLDHFLHQLFGVGAWILPILLLAMAVSAMTKYDMRNNTTRIFGSALFFTSVLGLLHLSTPMTSLLSEATRGSGGGYVGFVLNFILRKPIGEIGAAVIFSTSALIGVLIAFEISFLDIIELFEFRKIKKTIKKQAAQVNITNSKSKSKTTSSKSSKKQKTKKQLPPTANVKTRIPGIKQKSLFDKSKFKPKTTNIKGWILPDLDLLDDDEFTVVADDATIRKQAQLIANTLFNFGIAVEMKDVNIGPTVIQYTLKPAEGIKLTRITSLQNDLALALAASSIRIEAPIAGKSLVGIEIPAKRRSTVRLRSLLESHEYLTSKGSLRIVLGRNISGEPMIDKINSMPHLLIAGATGAGKSVCINSILVTLLYQNSPNNLKLILIDPKRVELNFYNNIPHLLTPVITNPEKTVSALRWAVAEMNRRYKLCAEHKCRDIDSFNKLSKDDAKLPFIVIVIDELADIMMAAPKEVEALICRIAQMARAVGIHLIIATQRPSVDVVTGLIKANIAARVAFKVSALVDSRTIIDSSGAEKLLGQGDMLFLPGDGRKPMRVQGVFISSQETRRVINEIKLTSEPAYNTDIIREKQAVPVGIPASSVQFKDDQGFSDKLEAQAVETILQAKKASASLLQRRLKIGYARAARILDILETKNIVGPQDGAKPREILISRSEEPADTATPALTENIE